MSGTELFAKTEQKANVWITELMLELDEVDPHRAYRTLRAVLHALRDRLSVEEAADLAAEMPMLIRGLYYEGWTPSRTPMRGRRPEDLLDRLAGELMTDDPIEAHRAFQAVVRVLMHHISPGELSDVKHCLPRPLRELWPLA